MTINQPVAIQSAYNNETYIFGYVVTKMTPGGQVVVTRKADTVAGTLENEMRFDKDGYRMGTSSSKYRRERLIVDVNAAHEAVRVRTARMAAAEAVNAVRGDAGRYNDKESLKAQVAKLAELLEAARVAIEAI